MQARIELYLAVVFLFAFFALDWLTLGPLVQIKAHRLASTLDSLAEAAYAEEPDDTASASRHSLTEILDTVLEQAERERRSPSFSFMNLLWITPAASALSLILNFNDKRKEAFWLLDIGAIAVIGVMGYYVRRVGWNALDVFGIGAWISIIAALVGTIAHSKYKRELNSPEQT